MAEVEQSTEQHASDMELETSDDNDVMPEIASTSSSGHPTIQRNMKKPSSAAPENSDTQSVEYDVRGILQKHPQGKEVLHEYDEHQMISKDNRCRLVRILVGTVMERHGTHPTSSQKESLAKHIVRGLPLLHSGHGVGYQHFYTPGKKTIGATGFIQTRVENVQRRLARRSGSTSSRKKIGGGDRDDITPAGRVTVTLSPTTEDLDIKKNWLRFNREPRGTVRQYMRDTRGSRLFWINDVNGPTIEQIFEQYPRYADDDGHVWIEEDFQFLYPDKHDRLTGLWERHAGKLLQLVRLGPKEDSVKRLLADLPVDGGTAAANAALYLLPNLLPPKAIGKSKKNVSRWKPSTAESRASFIDVLKVGSSIEQYRALKRQECQKRNITWQPQIVVLGDIVNPAQVFVLVNNTLYEVQNIIKAVDVCLKCFFVLNAQYPPHATEPWLFLQKAIFAIETEYDVRSARVDELVGMISRQ